MARIVGVEIPDDKRIEVALTYIHGIGHATSKKILKETKIDPSIRVENMTDNNLRKIYDYIEQNIATEGKVRQVVFRNIKRLKDIRAYRGVRHRIGLPARGQNTRSNCRTKKGRAIAVGGLKVKTEKK